MPKKVTNILLDACVLAAGYADPFIFFSLSLPRDTVPLVRILTRAFLEFRGTIHSMKRNALLCTGITYQYMLGTQITKWRILERLLPPDFHSVQVADDNQRSPQVADKLWLFCLSENRQHSPQRCALGST